MQTAILCGGRATRLLPISADVPKSLVRIGGEPFIAHQLRLLRANGIGEAVLCVGHLGDAIEAFVGDGSAYGVRVRYSRDGFEPLGTGGALRHALPLLAPQFFVLYGDTYLDCDYRAVMAAFAASSCAGLLTIARPGRDRYRANVAVRGRAVVRYHKTQAHAAMTHMYWGLGVFRRDAIAAYNAPPAFDLGDFFIEVIAASRLGAFEVDRRHYEIGCPEGLLETRALFASQ